MGDAVLAVESGRPAVLAAAADTAESWPRVVHGVQFVRCPAELSESFTCTQCGNGSPLCARGDRNYVVVFVGHGSHKKEGGQGRARGMLWHVRPGNDPMEKSRGNWRRKRRRSRAPIRG